MFMFFLMTTDEVHEHVVCLYYLVESQTKIWFNRSINMVSDIHIYYIRITLVQSKFSKVNNILFYVFFIKILFGKKSSTKNVCVSIFSFITSDRVLDYGMGRKLSFATTCFDFLGM